MKNFIFIIFLSFLMCSCGLWKPDTGSNEAIILNITADEKLNLFNEKPHTVHIVVYQLSNPNAFTQLTQDQDGLMKLLKGEIFDGSVTFVDNITVFPGSKESHSLFRAEGTKHVGIAAGYTVLDKDRMIRKYKIPIKKVWKIWSFFTGKEEIIKPLKINFVFGPQQITKDECIEE